jgi:phosphoglycolate phosphatase
VTEDYDAIVYDLDGTLVHLDVDWEAARRDAAAVLRDRGVDTAEMGLWDVLEAAEPSGALDGVNAAIAEHEREGARRSERLPVADELPRQCPVGVCSLNSESACRIALDRHGLDAHVRTVVGRDTLATYKPDPEPLLTTVAGLGVEPGRVLFVGDSERDVLTAERAGVDFQWAAERLD